MRGPQVLGHLANASGGRQIVGDNDGKHYTLYAIKRIGIDLGSGKAREP